MKNTPRSESEVFSTLSKLCTSPGYVHAIAFICFRDNTLGIANELETEEVIKAYSPKHLIRTEISTILGLACKGKIDDRLPSPSIVQRYIDETDSLLEELHQSMIKPTIDAISASLKDSTNPFENGSVLREPIFYSGDSAYHFQYRDLSQLKYKNDDPWFKANKGYSIAQAARIITAISNSQNQKVNDVIIKLRITNPKNWTILPAYKFTISEIAIESKEDEATVKSFISSFVAPENVNKNEFTSINNFNPLNAYPIIRLNEEEFLLFQYYSLVEACYETPFFWFIEDKFYKDTALKNRGTFVEEFSTLCLQQVFGKNHVFTNVNIFNKSDQIGEIDVLVLYGNRAILIQAKSKKLTIESRKGNDSAIIDDFKKAVQNAYDQAYQCATFLTNAENILIDSAGNELEVNRNFVEIYPFCIISDHYPSLSFQVRQFLKFQTTEKIMPPYIMDIFFLDVLCELLQSPLHFFSFINRRILYGDKLLANGELSILGLHIKNNLWVENGYSLLVINDDYCADIDIAMMARRENIPGKKTPDGILTRFQGTFFGSVINQIEKREELGIIDLGIKLLELSETTVDEINNGINNLIVLYKRDKKHHDLTIGVKEGSTGFTFHCNNESHSKAFHDLTDHCLRRKYIEKAKSWFGLCINPTTLQIRFGVGFDFSWEHSEEMDKLIS
jgi:hypothetical protein